MIPADRAELDRLIFAELQERLEKLADEAGDSYYEGELVDDRFSKKALRGMTISVLRISRWMQT